MVYAQNILSAIFGIFSAIIVIRSLGITQYGVLTLAMSTMGLLMPFMDFGIGQVVTVDIAGEIGAGRMDRVKKLFFGFAKMEIGLGIILSGGLFAVSYFISSSYGDVFYLLLRISAALLLMNSFRNIMLVSFGGFSKFKALSVIQAAESAFKFIFVLVFVLGFKYGSLGAMTAYLSATSLAVIFVGLPMLLRVLANFRGIAPSTEPIFKNLIFGHGKFQILSQPLKNFLESARSWIITILAGVEALAVFQVAFQIYSYISMFLGSIEAVLMPIFSEELSKSLEVARKLLIKMTKYTVWLAVVAMVGAWIAIPPVLELFFGDKYLASVPLILYAIISLPIDAAGLLFRPALFSLKAQKSLFKINIYLLSMIFLSAVLTHFYGAWGFILTMPFGSVMALFLRYRYLVAEKPELFFSPLSIFSWDSYDRELVGRIWGRITGRY